MELAPDVVVGMALAAARTNFSVSNGLGSGDADMFQAGGFVRYAPGASYLTGALAYGRQEVDTDRMLTISGIDVLHGEFTSNSLSGRLESGYRIMTSGMGVTPFAAGEFTTTHIPGYDEQVIIGSNTFALSYASNDVTTSRTELGVRTDKSYLMDDAILTLRGRIAWAHYFDIDRSSVATFQALPGATFEVNGAGQDANTALTSASAELVWSNGFSLGGTFESEFSDDSRSYSGKGVLKYEW